MSDLNDDDELMSMLGDALEDDPIPETALSFARSTQRLLMFKSELAELTSDLMADELVALRSNDESRVLRFEVRNVELELELDGSSVSGIIDPPCETIGVTTLGGRTDIPVSSRGVFQFDVPNEPFRLEFNVDGLDIRTAFIRP